VEGTNTRKASTRGLHAHLFIYITLTTGEGASIASWRDKVKGAKKWDMSEYQTGSHLGTGVADRKA